MAHFLEYTAMHLQKGASLSESPVSINLKLILS